MEKMKTKIKLWNAIIFITIAIMVVDSAIIFPIVFASIGIAFALWFHHDIKHMSREEFDNLFGIKDE